MGKFICFIFLIAFMVPTMAKNYALSDHYDGERFFNPRNHELKSFWQVLKWKLTSSPAEWPEWLDNKDFQFPLLIDGSGILTFINHSTFLIQLKGFTILTDPVFSKRVSPVSFAGPARVREPGLLIDELPPVDVVLVSHNHYDHLDLDSLRELDEKYHPLFLVPLGDEELLQSAGIQNIKELDWWDEVEIKGNKITFTPSQHWSARSLWDKCESLWGSYMIEQESNKIYFAGDTGYEEHFKEIQGKLGSPIIALLPIGAYEPRWFMKAFHMNPEEAVMAHLDLKTPLSFGMHFGTFQLTDEAYHRPLEDLKLAQEKLRVTTEEFRVLDFGESFSF